MRQQEVVGGVHLEYPENQWFSGFLVPGNTRCIFGKLIERRSFGLPGMD